MKKTIILAISAVALCAVVAVVLGLCLRGNNETPVDQTATTTTVAENNDPYENTIDFGELMPTTAKTSYVTVTDKNNKPVTTYVTVTEANGSAKTTYVVVTEPNGTAKTTQVVITGAGTTQTSASTVTSASAVTSASVVTTAVTVTDPTTTATTTVTTAAATTPAGTTTSRTVQYDSTEGWSPIKPPSN